jgi:hypothetical protein
MLSTPPPAELSYNGSGTNHTFAASSDICSDCHAFGAETVTAGVETNLEMLKGLIEDALFDLISNQIAAGNRIDLNGEFIIDGQSMLGPIMFSEYRGRQAITVDLMTHAPGPYRVNDVKVVDAGNNVLGQLYDFADNRIIKAGWNYHLIHSDGSSGIHNPTFTNAVLDASIAALEALAAE